MSVHVKLGILAVLLFVSPSSCQGQSSAFAYSSASSSASSSTHRKEHREGRGGHHGDHHGFHDDDFSGFFDDDKGYHFGDDDHKGHHFDDKGEHEEDDPKPSPSPSVIIVEPSPSPSVIIVEPPPSPSVTVVVTTTPAPPPPPPPSPMVVQAEAEEEDCVYEPDFSTLEASLRSSIFAGSVEKVAAALKSNRTFSLSAGMTYTAEQECLVVRSENREKDPDVVAFRGVALNAQKTGEVDKLARVMVQSFVSDCQTCLFSADELDGYVESFTKFLSDRRNLQEVLQGDPTELGARRKLLVTESSPTNSFVCAYCYPNTTCSDMRWC